MVEVNEHVLDLLRLAATGEATLTQVAEELDVSEATVHRLVEGYLKAIKEHAKSAKDAEVEAAIQDYKSGIPVHQIVANRDLSQGKLYQELRSRDVQLRRGADRKDREKRVIQMYAKGEQLFTIEVETGYSCATIYRILHQNDIPLRRS